MVALRRAGLVLALAPVILLALPAVAQGPVWAPPLTFDRRPVEWPDERPQDAHIVIHAILADQLFGSNRDLDPAPFFPDFAKHVEIVQAYAFNAGRSPWSGELRLSMAEGGTMVARPVSALGPGQVAAVSFVGYLDVPGPTLTVTATALEGTRVADTYTRVGEFHARPPPAAPGAFVRDLGAPATLPGWLDVLPIAFSILNTMPTGYTHVESCDDLGCADTVGHFWSGTYRWLNAEGTLVGAGCLRTHVDQHPASVGHALHAGTWDHEVCLTA